MAQWVRGALVMQTKQHEFDPDNFQRHRKREFAPQRCPLFSTHTMTNAPTHPYKIRIK